MMNPLCQACDENTAIEVIDGVYVCDVCARRIHEDKMISHCALIEFMNEGMTYRQALNALHGFPLDWTPETHEDDTSTKVAS